MQIVRRKKLDNIYQRISRLEDKKHWEVDMQLVSKQLDMLYELRELVKNSPEIPLDLNKRGEHSKKAVLQYNMDGELLGEYESINEASNLTKINASSISNVLAGRYFYVRDRQKNKSIFKYKN